MESKNQKTGSRKTERLPSLATLQIGDCFIRATLDTRHGKDEANQKYSAVITFYIRNDRTHYKRLPYTFTRKEFEELCRPSGRGKNTSPENNEAKANITEEFNKTAEKLRESYRRGPITKEAILSLLGNKKGDSFTDFWQEFNMTKSTGTRISYENARQSFIKAVGTLRRPYITAADIKLWEKSMTGLSRTTVGIYERACKAAWNEAVRRKLISREEPPFGKIPQGASRKHEWLNTKQMTELYVTFLDRRYPEDWTQAQADTCHRAVGLFLFQYLANGCNLADVAQLRYNDDYFQSGEKLLTFTRQKTENRSGTGVMIPITPPLRKIMEGIASTPERDGTLFPYLLRGENNPDRVKALVSLANKNVQKWLNKLTDHLGWTARPSGTWARHSFATNLTHAGVPDRYISEAMGHSVETVTSRYIDTYPLEQQVRYNTKLLNLPDEQENRQTNETVTLTREEYENLLRRIQQ